MRFARQFGCVSWEPKLIPSLPEAPWLPNRPKQRSFERALKSLDDSQSSGSFSLHHPAAASLPVTIMRCRICSAQTPRSRFIRARCAPIESAHAQHSRPARRRFSVTCSVVLTSTSSAAPLQSKSAVLSLPKLRRSHWSFVGTKTSELVSKVIAHTGSSLSSTHPLETEKYDLCVG